MCKHLNVKTTDWATEYTTDGGPVYDITSYTYCMDCGATIETPTSELLEIDREPTVYEIEQRRRAIKQNHELPV